MSCSEFRLNAGKAIDRALRLFRRRPRLTPEAELAAIAEKAQAKMKARRGWSGKA